MKRWEDTTRWQLQRKAAEDSDLIRVEELDPKKPTVLLLPFKSRFQRDDLPKRPFELQTRNQDFPIRVYLPPQASAKGPFSRFYLMHNGFGESQAEVYDILGLDLANRKKVPSVFLPLPLHYCRHHKFQHSEHDPYEPLSKDWSIITTQRILQSIIRSPGRLMKSFAQTLSDQEELFRLIDDGGQVFSEILKKQAKVSLFGYSFGGFSAMAYTLLFPRRVRKLFLFESGGFVDDIDGGSLFGRSDSVARCLWSHYYVHQVWRYKHEPLFSKREGEKRRDFEAAIKWRQTLKVDPARDFRDLFHTHPDALKKTGKHGDLVYREPHHVLRRPTGEGKEIWQDIMEGLYEAPVDDISPKHLGLFKQVYLGHQHVKYNRNIQRQGEKILVISGGADDVFPTRELLRLGPETGLALLQVPGITHFVRHKSFKQWLGWVRIIVDMMESFDKH